MKSLPPLPYRKVPVSEIQGNVTYRNSSTGSPNKYKPVRGNKAIEQYEQTITLEEFVRIRSNSDRVTSGGTRA